MATGPEHYREAERLLAQAERWERNVQDDTWSYASIDAAHRAALVHAYLATAAATADVGMKYDGSIRNEDEWREVTKS